MNRKIVFSEGEFYHIYNRGNDKRVIFNNISDYQRFLNLLFFCNSGSPVQMSKLTKKLSQGVTLTEFLVVRGDTLVDIGAYCLMPNHFHLLLHEKIKDGITMFLKKLCTAYSMYFNLKNERTGKLFEGVFQAKHTDSDEYLKYLFAYIHLNPVKLIEPEWRETGLSEISGAYDFVKKYNFSSYKIYLDSELEGNHILNKSAFPEYFDKSNIAKEMNEWLNFGPTNRSR